MLRGALGKVKGRGLSERWVRRTGYACQYQALRVGSDGHLQLDKGLQLVYVWANTNGVQSRKAAAEPDENLILGLEPQGGAMNKN